MSRSPLSVLLAAVAWLVSGTAAWAQVVSAVPSGARAVTVMLCDRPDGCPTASQALAVHAADARTPVLDFDRVVAQGPASGEARVSWDRAYSDLEAQPSLASARMARGVLRGLDQTVPPGDLLDMWLWVGALALDAGATEDAAEAFRAAAAVGQGRVHDLPPLSTDALTAYMDAIDALRGQTSSLAVRADALGAQVYVDGRHVGQAPTRLELAPGWHRVSVERRGRESAWVGEVTLVAGRHTEILGRVAPDDGVASLEASILAGVRGAALPEDVIGPFADWGAAHGLDWVRFVLLVDSTADRDGLPEERVSATDPDAPPWNVHALWLDVRLRRIDTLGPGLQVLDVVTDRDRFRVGMGLGYLHLSPRHHVAYEIATVTRLSRRLQLDARVGLMRTGQPYYLYDAWVDRQLYPVTAALRAGRLSGGPYAAAGALLVVPYAFGGQLLAGWDFAPTPRWHVAIEGRGAFTDQGWGAGAGLVFAWSG